MANELSLEEAAHVALHDGTTLCSGATTWCNRLSRNALNEGPAIADEASREKGCVCRFNLAKDGETAVPCQYIITGGKDMNRNYEEHLANMHSDILITKQEDGVAACYAICKYVKPDGKVCDTEDLRGTLGLRPYYDVVRHTLRVTKKHM